MSSSDEATIGLFNIVFKYVHKSKKAKKKFSILDVGSGLGKNGFVLKHFSWLSDLEIFLVGIDLWKPYLELSATANVYDALLVGDLRFLPFRPQSFDVIVLSEILEHLPKVEAYKSLTCLEQLSKKDSIIVLTTPQAYQQQEVLRDNPYEIHRSVWKREELRKLGYTVTTTPLVIRIWKDRWFLTSRGLSELKSSKTKLFDAFLFMIAALSVFLPNFSGKIIAYKVIER